MKFRNQRGASTVEFVLIAPLLLLILFGIIEFTVLLYDKAMLTNASREGARTGIVFIKDRSSNVSSIESNIDAAVNQYCGTHLISFGSGSTCVITPTWIDNNGSGPYDSGDSLQVEVKYNFRFLVFSNLLSLFGGSMNDAFDLNAITTMRLE